MGERGERGSVSRGAAGEAVARGGKREATGDGRQQEVTGDGTRWEAAHGGKQHTVPAVLGRHPGPWAPTGGRSPHSNE